MRTASILALVVLLGAASLVLSASAQSPKSAPGASANPSKGQAQPQPEKLLRQMADYLGNLPAFSCRTELVANIQAQGINNNMTTKVNIRLARPNRLAIVLDGDTMGLTVISDGKTLTQYVSMLNRYTEQAAPPSLAELTSASSGISLSMLSAFIPVTGEAFYKSLTDGVTGSEYVGQEKVGDVLCHHCRFMREDLNWDIWIDASERPLVHKAVIDFSKQFAEVEGRMQGAKVEYVGTFHEWNAAPQFTDADFAFAPPAGAEKVDSLRGNRASEGPHPLVGRPAPQFKTVNLRDEPIELATHLGKDVVLLDFWATWCGPCVEAMPEVIGVSKKFADRGVVFYAVNVAEDADTVKEFLKANELEAPVAMDVDGNITQQYLANGIPQTVLIGKDGKVQVVHVGFGPNLADVLSEQIEALLAGEDLAAATLAGTEEPQEAEAATGE